ncbi:MAG: hypothetical protein RIR33_1334 [Pseudomonadota bacterium]|jgi:predicted transcriptional regulator of viral defense system
MISEASPRARFWIDSLAKAGRAHFTSAEARQALGGTADAVRLSLHRLSKQTLIASPGRGFYVIVPPEYRSLGCLPAEQFIPALMKHLKLPYYAAMLSAAQFYGAAHHAPQEFQVMVARRRRRLVCGSVQVAFFFRPVIASVATRSFNTSRGEIAVSTPEFTAIDLVGYHQHAGGLDNVATILAELVEQLDPVKLVQAAATAPMPWAQRLGYLLERVHATDAAEPLRSYVRDRVHDYTPLLPSGSLEDATRDFNWKLVVNERVEAEV